MYSGFGDDLGTDEWLFDLFPARRRVRHFGRVIYNDMLPFAGGCRKTYVRYRGDHRLAKLRSSRFLYDLHMQHSQEAATETESQCLEVSSSNVGEASFNWSLSIQSQYQLFKHPFFGEYPAKPWASRLQSP